MADRAAPRSYRPNELAAAQIVVDVWKREAPLTVTKRTFTSSEAVAAARKLAEVPECSLCVLDVLRTSGPRALHYPSERCVNPMPAPVHCTCSGCKP